MKVGVVGTGWVADLHLQALRKIEGANVSAIAGRNLQRARELAEPFQANVYPDPVLMLKREKLDAVFILLPPHLHGELEQVCSEYVKGVLVEKPVTQSLETAQEISGFFQKAGTIVSVAYMNRYRNSVQQARKVLADDPGILANGWWISQMPPPLWWRSFDQSGGQFVEQCTHLVDVCRYTMGDIIEVSAYVANGFMEGVHGYSVDDAMVVNVRFKSGAIGSFSTGCFPVSGHSDDPGEGVELNVSSKKHRIVLSGWGLQGSIFSGHTRPERISSEENIFEIQNRAFLHAVDTGSTDGILSNYEDGMRTLAVTLAANESARNRKGGLVKVPSL